MNRVQRFVTFPENVRVCNSSLADVALGSRGKGKFLVARLDGAYYYQFSGPNVVGFLKQRRPDLLPFLSWMRFLPDFPDVVSLSLNRYLNRAAVWLLKHADAVVFQSQLSRRMYTTFGGYQGGRVPETVILNGVDLEEFNPHPCPRLEGDPAIIISASLYRLHKRLQDAVCLVNYLADQFPRIRLHVLGDCDPLVRPLLDTLDTSRCIFHGYVDATTLRQYYAGADLQMSLTIFDACPNVVCEGLASGLPIVTPLESGAAELVGPQNARWCVEEGLALEYRSLHVASSIPQAPLDRYASVVTQIIQDLKTQKQHARARAEEALNIRVVARQYEQFIAHCLR